ncbi:branched-chain amino acid ABC transporter substrate-binding protein [Desulfocicer vacuolatum]|uniref:branched-chain amino acid ABC transporter substrate-binding protein n=1 Tax=Desulfocicer vacuolatum TaxID=2298 RepID=UPI001483A3E5|nr:branched-chain amino acid ABC transporter substrate-binding protein [Desulfocicer vacuolatum]
MKIGILQALTGKVASIGKGQIRGIELALEDRNGKVAGHDVLFQIEDTGCSPEGGANAVLKILADPEQIAILGTTCSGAAATVSRAMSSAGFTMVSGNNSATFLTAIGGRRAPQWQPGYFRTAPNEENAGKAAAMYAAKVLGVSKAAVINDGDIYTQGLTHSFVKMFKGLGGKVVLDTAINKGDKEMAPVLTATINSGAEFLFCPLFQPEGNYILLKTREMSGFENIPVMSAGALIDRSFLNAVGEKARGMYFVGPSSPATSITKELGKKYTLKYGAPPSTSYYLSAYDAATLLFEAIEKVAVPGHVPGTLYIGRQALRKTLYGIKKFKGATGLLTCDEFGDCGDPAFDVFRMDEPSLGMEGLLLNVQFSYSPVGQREEDVAGAHK